MECYDSRMDQIHYLVSIRDNKGFTAKDLMLKASEERIKPRFFKFSVLLPAFIAAERIVAIKEQDLTNGPQL